MREHYKNDQVKMQVVKLLRFYSNCQLDKSGDFLSWRIHLNEVDGDGILMVNLSNIDSIYFHEDKAVLTSDRKASLYTKGGEREYDKYEIFAFASVAYIYEIPKQVSGNTPFKRQISDVRMDVEKLLKLYPYCHLDDRGEYLCWERTRGSVLGSVLLSDIYLIEFFENKAILHCDEGTLYDGYTEIEFSEKYINYPEASGYGYFRLDS